MLRTILFVAACLLLTSIVSAQQKIGDNTLILDPASLLELESTSQGFLPSRMTTVQRNAQTEWDEGHQIYNTTDNCYQIYNGTSWDCFAQGTIIDSSIYRYNGSLLADRTVTMNGNSLTFDGSGGDIVITSDGDIGIGDPTPDAKLDVEGGTVRLSDYGTGMINGSESFYLGVDSVGDVIEISPAIDTFSLIGDELRISLKGDTLSYDSVNLAKYLDNTDDQILDSLGLTGTILEIGIEGDVNGLQSIDLSSIDTDTDTDNQVIDSIALVGTTLELSLEDDGEALKMVDLSSLQDGTGTDDQILDSLGLTGNTLEIGIEGDVNGLQSIDLSSIDTDTDNQVIDSIALTGTTLELSLEDDSEALKTVDLSSLQDGTGTDDQILDSLGLTGTTLEIGIEGDANGLQTLDLTPILGSSENIYNTSDSLSADRVVTLDGNSLTFDGATDADVIIQSDGDVGIGTTSPSGDFQAISDEDQNAFSFIQETGTTGEKDVFTIEDQDAGNGTQDESSVLKVVKSGDISSSDNGFSLVELANTGTDPGASKYWISGRKTDEGAPLWGVDINDNDFWSEGGIVLGVTGADGGTYSGGNFIVEPDGDVGIGTTAPGARLEVDGGSVIFDEYGIGTYSDTSANYILATDTAGNVVELNTAKNTRWFYPPAVIIDASAISVDDTLDLHAEYITQFGSPLIKNPEAPAFIPTYDKDELYYFISYYDTDVLENITIDDDGVMVYDVKAVPFDNFTVINVVFLIKD